VGTRNRVPFQGLAEAASGQEGYEAVGEDGPHVRIRPMFGPVGQRSMHTRSAVRGDEVFRHVRERPTDAVAAYDRRPYALDLRNRHQEVLELVICGRDGQVVSLEERLSVPKSRL